MGTTRGSVVIGAHPRGFKRNRPNSFATIPSSVVQGVMPISLPQSFLSEISVIAIFIVSAMLEAIRSCPEGFEDEDGFHTFAART
jgi:hypothetical protein